MFIGLTIAILCSFIALLYGLYTIKWVLAQPSGNNKMAEIAKAIIEFKMEIDTDEFDGNTRDYDVQQHKAEVIAAFKHRLDRAFSEGYKMYTFEFGIDTGWHEDLEKLT